MNITIEGLNEQQREIADMLWSAEDEYDVGAIEFLFPQDTFIVKNMMIAAIVDQQVQEMDSFPAAIELLDTFRG